MNKIRGSALALSLLLPLQLHAQNLDLSDSGVLVDGIAAVVNDGVVLLSELDEQTMLIVQRLRAENTELPPQEVLVPQVLERLIITELQLQNARLAGITVPDSMLNRALADVARRNGTTLGDLPAMLAADGIDYNMYRKELRQQLTIEQLRQREVISRIGVSPRELDEHIEREQGSAYRFNRYKISHILISVSAAATPDEIDSAQAKARDIYDQLQDGADFAQLAIAYSDAQNALEGGSMGWRNGESLPTLFAEVAPQLAEGEVSAPVRSPSGFHLILVEDIEGNERVMENQVRARHILLQTDELMDDAVVRQRLEDIREQLLAGDDFAAIATAVSEDPGSAVDGGDLGWAGPGTFVPEFESTLAALEINEISEPFKTPFGWHIIQLLDRRVH
ncbi:MAG: peptidylprolyl isomerase, partial [Gammaproteobacteria bacterium]|nr:peptidylprolyl isomerase [Gammaproteobacteria bacterium]